MKLRDRVESNSKIEMSFQITTIYKSIGGPTYCAFSKVFVVSTS